MGLLSSSRAPRSKPKVSPHLKPKLPTFFFGGLLETPVCGGVSRSTIGQLTGWEARFGCSVFMSAACRILRTLSSSTILPCDLVGPNLGADLGIELLLSVPKVG